MKRFFIGFILMFFLFFISACSRKTTPQKSATQQSIIEYKTDSISEVKELAPPPVTKPKTPEALPKVITVNDAAAKKSVDGRLYYDVNGKRYWKNFKDGKYYLFDKSMYENPDFKPPVK